MARYRVEHRYSSSTHGPWVEGDHVELDPEEAEWVNHDSEGTLKLVNPQEQAEEKRERQRAQNERLRREREERERRDKTERIQGVSQADEPTRMDDVPQAQREQADRVPDGLVKAPMEPTGGGHDDGRSDDTTDLPSGGVPRSDDHTGSESKDSTEGQKASAGSRSTKTTSTRRTSSTSRSSSTSKSK
jgi:hypothetical protein